MVNVKHILKYLWRTNDYMFVSLCEELVLVRYRELDFQSDEDSRSLPIGMCILYVIFIDFEATKEVI